MGTCRFALSVLVSILLHGCATTGGGQPQDASQVAVRKLGVPASEAVQPLHAVAPRLYVYAAMSENVYEPQSAAGASVALDRQSIATACNKGRPHPMPVGSDWHLWPAFPTNADALDKDFDLRVQLWAHRPADGDPIDAFVVAFRGTQPWHIKDWMANLRSFQPEREDHYTKVSNDIAKELQALLEQGLRSGAISPGVEITATGHSLGGGLAQHLAYAFRTPEQATLRIHRVLAFDASPVIGRKGIPGALRAQNAKGLTIDLVHERGEFLSYFRDAFNAVSPPSAQDPAIFDFRFAVAQGSHSMRRLACPLGNELLRAEPPPELTASQ